jgi:hypothetical protein
MQRKSKIRKKAETNYSASIPDSTSNSNSGSMFKPGSGALRFQAGGSQPLVGQQMRPTRNAPKRKSEPGMKNERF